MERPEDAPHGFLELRAFSRGQLEELRPLEVPEALHVGEVIPRGRREAQGPDVPLDDIQGLRPVQAARKVVPGARDREPEPERPEGLRVSDFPPSGVTSRVEAKENSFGSQRQ